jgi:hypothetical protein
LGNKQILLLFFLGLFAIGHAARSRFGSGSDLSDSSSISTNDDDDDTSSAEEEDHNQQDGRNSRVGVTMEELMQFRPSPEAEKLSGQELVNYVNRRQRLWRVRIKSYGKFSTYLSCHHIRPN